MKRFTYLLGVALLVAGSMAAGDKVRVFVTDSKSWEISGGFAATNNAAAGTVSGGARPQTAEIIKTFGEKCPDVTVTMRPERADYIVLLDHEGGKGWARKDNKVAVFNGEGVWLDIASHSDQCV